MKLEKIAVQSDVVREVMVTDEVIKFVDSFYKQFRDSPSKVAPIICVAEVDDPPDFWPKAQTGNGMSVIGKIISRLKPVRSEIIRRVKEDQSSFLSRYTLKMRYLGDGRVALYWSVRKPKRARHANRVH